MKLEPADLHLRLIPLADALAHETDDPAGVKELAELLQRDGVLRNPIIVAEARHAIDEVLTDHKSAV